MSRVVISDLHKHFPERQPGAKVHKRGAIDGLDLEIREGEFFVLLGPSGCGKTTTLRCIAGLEEPTAGSISIGDQPVSDATSGLFTPPDRRGLGMMFQSYALWPHMTVAENIAYPLKRRRAAKTEIGAEVARNLALVGLDGLQNRYPSELSGGQQQRVALARAVAAKPRLLLFDEPLSNLDAQLRAALRIELRRIHQETGATSVYVTHDQVEALALADRIAVLKDGRVEQLGTPDEVFLAPASRFVAAFVGYENILAGSFAADGFHVDGWTGALGGQAPVRGLASGQGHVAVRASSIRISLDLARAGTHEPRGTLEAVTYLGDRHLAQVRVGSDLVQALLPLGAWPLSRKAKGEVVALSASPDDIVPLRGSAAAPVALSVAA